jgi:predicted nucleotide-binding protein
VEARQGSKDVKLVVLDKDLTWIFRRILEPREQGTPIAIQGRELSWSEIAHVWISVSDVPSSQLIAEIQAADAATPMVIRSTSYKWRAGGRATDRTDDFITGPVGPSPDKAVGHKREPTSDADPRKVMVVHGRDDEARRAMFDFLRALGLAPMEWSSLVAETGSAAPYIGQVLTAAFATAKAVVVLFTPDDEGWLKEAFRKPDDPPEETQPTPQARSNVLFEAGMALGVHPDRTVLVELGKLRPFSDIYGRHVIRLNGTEGPLHEIAHRLKTAGCEIAENNSEWATTRFPERE